uniref:Uncharacterized protein n=1 Tax=Mantoniella antarctica TaxID=81844 RepID=A0A7S0SID0_9CHLO|eukprot:CAMPEP_0181365564 /NCGR_PEP_ID=MMETSP1106-20121128/10147_1 /TAXON_ID=81844 /ORGANISM="Mantoniella antarctica, Strain SL-175" /LENGTH=102 /DNA_ID=CAMNT_0023480673 /DNA_START=197 /DNA_END=505 /DNA_ORIENTATION=+
MVASNTSSSASGFQHKRGRFSSSASRPMWAREPLKCTCNGNEMWIICEGKSSQMTCEEKCKMSNRDNMSKQISLVTTRHMEQNIPGDAAITGFGDWSVGFRV